MTGICIPFFVAVADELWAPVVVSQVLHVSAFLRGVCSYATAPASTPALEQKSPTSSECQKVTE